MPRQIELARSSLNDALLHPLEFVERHVQFPPGIRNGVAGPGMWCSAWDVVAMRILLHPAWRFGAFSNQPLFIPKRTVRIHLCRALGRQGAGGQRNDAQGDSDTEIGEGVIRRDAIELTAQQWREKERA